MHPTCVEGSDPRHNRLTFECQSPSVRDGVALHVPVATALVKRVRQTGNVDELQLLGTVETEIRKVALDVVQHLARDTHLSKRCDG